MTPGRPRRRSAPGSRVRGAGGLVLALATAAVGLAAGPVGAAGQEAGAAARQQDGADAGERGWLGVGLRQTVRCETRMQARPDGDTDRSAQADCRRALVAEAVVEGAPADRAGIQPGDTLVAVNGRALARRSGQDELLALEPGTPAQLLLGRPGEGRVSLRVVPEPRPPGAGPAPVRTGSGEGAPVVPFTLPPDVLARAGDAAGAAGDGAARPGAVLLQTGDDGEVRIRWNGESVPLRKLEEVVPRLQQIRDSVFAQARRHMRALREHQRRQMEALRRAQGDGGAEEVAGDGVFRAAGAEFRPLTSGLAAYFPGAREGLLVLEVVSGTPAAELGLEPGDVVVEAGTRAVAAPGDFRAALADYPRQDSLVVKWLRQGTEMTGVLRRR